MRVYDSANILAGELRESQTAREYRALKEELARDETVSALMKEYKRLQIQLQLAAAAGAQPDGDSARRFEQMGALLYASPVASRFLLAEMRLQQVMADIYRILNDASGIDYPGL